MKALLLGLFLGMEDLLFAVLGWARYDEIGWEHLGNESPEILLVCVAVMSTNLFVAAAWNSIAAVDRKLPH